MDVEQQQIRLQLSYRAHGLGEVTRPLQQFVLSSAQEHLQRCANHRMVVDKQNSGHAAAPARGRSINIRVSPGVDSSCSEPLARSTLSLSDQGRVFAGVEKPQPLSATLS